MQSLNPLRPTAVALVAMALVACNTKSDTADQDTGTDDTGTDDTADQDTGTADLDMQVVRVSASEMTDDQIDRFKRAFSYAIDEGWMDAFCDAHSDHDQRHHGAELMPNTPLLIRIMSTTHGHRLLPWHRSFVWEAEAMLQAALREVNTADGLDPAEGDLVFIPYWDAAHDQAVPDWVDSYLPPGGTAIAPENLPEGHAGYGNEGQRYDIEIGRWPGTHPGFRNLARPDQIERILNADAFDEFYTGIDYRVEITSPDLPGQAALDALSETLPDDSALHTVLTAIGGDVLSNEEAVEIINAVAEVGHEVATNAAEGTPDDALAEALDLVMEYVKPPPHALMHLWAGGLDPNDPEVRGTITYFNELCVDPLFWMLHTELDRYWFTWEQTHSELPPLDGDDAIFHPIANDVGAIYGGGQSYTLDELTDLDNLPFTYDEVFRP